MTTVTKISARGQVTVPTEVREALGIEADDLLVWDLNDDGTATVSRLATVARAGDDLPIEISEDWPVDPDAESDAEIVS